jgi:predicted DNA-binding transcriptional regulator YafY
VPDELAIAVATALANKGAELVAAAGRSAIDALGRFVRQRFGRGTRESAVLDAAADDPNAQQELAELLDRAMSDDPEFAIRLRSLWQNVSADRGSVVNQFSGHAQKVVQARDIRGNVTL